MQRREEIEQLLMAELNDARTAYEAVKKQFSEALANAPSGILNSGDMARINDSAEQALSAMKAWMKALREFSDWRSSLLL